MASGDARPCGAFKRRRFAQSLTMVAAAASSTRRARWARACAAGCALVLAYDVWAVNADAPVTLGVSPVLGLLAFELERRANGPGRLRERPFLWSAGALALLALALTVNVVLASATPGY